MLKILVAPASYKGSIAAHGLATAMAQGCEELLAGDMHHLYGEFEIIKAPIADGGDDTVVSLHQALGGDLVYEDVIGPTGQTVRAAYLKLSGSRAGTAIVELAQASGIAYLKENELAPLTAHTYGTGQLIGSAIAGGAKKIVIGIGGSASTDGGTGALAALGAKFLDSEDQPVDLGGGSLSRIAKIDLSQAHFATAGVEFVVATDVTSPLTGKTGAAAIFGPQKGASPADVELLDAGLKHLASMLDSANGNFEISRLLFNTDSIEKIANLLKPGGIKENGDLEELVTQIKSVEGAFLFIGNDGKISTLDGPPNEAAEAAGLSALTIYQISKHVCHEMGYSELHQIIARTSQGCLTVGDVGDSLFAVLTNSNAFRMGAGAAGGAGFGFATMLGAQIVPGFDYFAWLVDLETKLKWCDVVVVAEGRLDSQSTLGKGVGEVIKLAAKHNKTVIVLPAVSTLEETELADLCGAYPAKLVLLPVAMPGTMATADDVRQATKRALSVALERSRRN